MRLAPLRLPTLGLALLAGACLSPSPAPAVRWFVPATPAPTAAPAGTTAAPLQLAQVRADGHLDARMLLRTSDVEIFPDEMHRWLADPAVFVTQALEAALFESGRFAPAVDAPTLRAHLRAFEAVLGASPTAVVVMDLALVHDNATQRTTIRSAVPLDDDRPETIARGLGAAIAASAGFAADWAGGQGN